ncbi:MAG: hypothetical protein ACJAVI_006102 [Candidatus Azotimanducaceae bacterium]|jgi:hypothetical protein
MKVKMGEGMTLTSVLVGTVLLLMSLDTADVQMTDSRIEGRSTAVVHFARLVYGNTPGSRRALRGWGNAWSTDYPEAEYQLMKGVNRLIRIDGRLIDCNGYGGLLITLDDNRQTRSAVK